MEYKIFGCKVNKYFTDKWLGSEYLKDKKGIFIATCVVTDRAKKKWIKFIKDNVKNLKKGEKLFISGCGNIKKGEVQEDFYDLYPELIEFREKIELLPENPNLTPLLRSSPLQIGEGLGVRFTKKFLLIQSGCDSFCTFCLTVLKRGKHFSRSKEEIVEEILEFERNSGKEVVLTGVNLGAWGSDNTNDIKNSKFAELLNYILENTKIPRIRISSLGPEFVNDEVLEIFKNKRIYPHFHYSVQSGSSKILKSMNRHYDGKYIENLLEKTKNLQREDSVEVSIGADLIVGFPGETEKDFLETYNLVKKGLVTKVHVFPFSAHKIGETVPASHFPNQIDEKTKKERVKKIEEIGEKVRNEFKKRNIGKPFEVLVEVVRNEDGKLKWKGWTENYIEVNEEKFEIFSGEIKRNSIMKGVLRS